MISLLLSLQVVIVFPAGIAFGGGALGGGFLATGGDEIVLTSFDGFAISFEGEDRFVMGNIGV
jgi:hypothetical protein